MSKKLVAYFSATGKTRRAARCLARAAQADLFEIRPAIPYSQEDLDWTNPESRSSKEMNDPSSRPAMAEKLAAASEYDTIFIGFPIWWYVAPHIIHTFLESDDFSKKTLVPFATSGSSGMGNTLEQLKAVVPDACWKEGKVVNTFSQQDYARWIKTI